VKKFNFPVWLKGSEEDQKAEAERQALTLASFTRAHQTEAERLVGRGKLLEETARLNLEASEGKSGLAQAQLADAMAMQGKYAEAAEIHPNPARTEHFENIIAALEMPDDEKCVCQDTRAHVTQIAGRDVIRKLAKGETVDTASEGGTVISLTPRFERARIFSPIHNDVVSLVECRKCGHLNARPLRSRVLQHNDARAQNEAAAQGKSPLRVSDVQILNAGT
jgi:hypothetical protein